MKKFLIAIYAVIFCMMPIQASENDLIPSPEQTTGYICDGTVWESVALVLKQGHDPDAESISDIFETIIIKSWIDGTEEIGGTAYMKVWTSTSRYNYDNAWIKYIRTDGERVYLLTQEGETAGEHLLYDFSLQPGDEIEIDPIFSGEIMQNTPSSVRCMNTNEETSENSTYKTCKLGVYIDGKSAEPILNPIKWIRGIGSETGLLDNIQSPESGGSRLMNVYHNGELIYKYSKPDSSGIGSTLTDSTPYKGNHKKYHLDGSEFREGDSGIYIQNGRKVLNNR